MSYKSILLSLKEHALFKSGFSIFGWLAATLGGIFSLNIEMVIFLIIVITVDFISGNYKAFKNGEIIHSSNWRNTVRKSIEYFVIIFLFAGLSNVFGEPNPESAGWVTTAFEYGLKNIVYLPFFFLICTEIKSIGENLGYGDIVNKILETIKNKVSNG